MWGFFRRPEKFSVAHLQQVQGTIVKHATAVTEGSTAEQALVTAIKELSELLVYSDKRKARFFELFCEWRMLRDLAALLRSPRHSNAVKTQVLQTVMILLQNLDDERSLLYMLSNNQMNQLIEGACDACRKDEELLAYTASFMRALSLRLNKDTIHFFLVDAASARAAAAWNATGHGSRKGAASAAAALADTDLPDQSFPLYVRALDLFDHEEGMVRIAARTVTLNVFKIQSAAIDKFASAPPHSRFLRHVASQVGRLAEAIQTLCEQILVTAAAAAAAASHDSGGGSSPAAASSGASSDTDTPTTRGGDWGDDSPVRVVMVRCQELLSELADLVFYAGDVSGAPSRAVSALLDDALWEELVWDCLLPALRVCVETGQLSPAIGSASDGLMPQRRVLAAPLALQVLALLFRALPPGSKVSARLTAAFLGLRLRYPHPAAAGAAATTTTASESGAGAESGALSIATTRSGSNTMDDFPILLDTCVSILTAAVTTAAAASTRGDEVVLRDADMAVATALAAIWASTTSSGARLYPEVFARAGLGESVRVRVQGRPRSGSAADSGMEDPFERLTPEQLESIKLAALTRRDQLAACCMRALAVTAPPLRLATQRLARELLQVLGILPGSAAEAGGLPPLARASRMASERADDEDSMLLSDSEADESDEEEDDGDDATAAEEDKDDDATAAAEEDDDDAIAAAEEDRDDDATAAATDDDGVATAAAEEEDDNDATAAAEEEDDNDATVAAEEDQGDDATASVPAMKSSRRIRQGLPSTTTIELAASLRRAADVTMRLLTAFADPRAARSALCAAETAAFDHCGGASGLPLSMVTKVRPCAPPSAVLERLTLGTAVPISLCEDVDFAKGLVTPLWISPQALGGLQTQPDDSTTAAASALAPTSSAAIPPTLPTDAKAMPEPAEVTVMLPPLLPSSASSSSAAVAIAEAVSSSVTSAPGRLIPPATRTAALEALRLRWLHFQSHRPRRHDPLLTLLRPPRRGIQVGMAFTIARFDAVPALHMLVSPAAAKALILERAHAGPPGSPARTRKSVRGGLASLSAVDAAVARAAARTRTGKVPAKPVLVVVGAKFLVLARPQPVGAPASGPSRAGSIADDGSSVASGGTGSSFGADGARSDRAPLGHVVSTRSIIGASSSTVGDGGAWWERLVLPESGGGHAVSVAPLYACCASICPDAPNTVAITAAAVEPVSLAVSVEAAAPSRVVIRPPVTKEESTEFAPAMAIGSQEGEDGDDVSSVIANSDSRSERSNSDAPVSATSGGITRLVSNGQSVDTAMRPAAGSAGSGVVSGRSKRNPSSIGSAFAAGIASARLSAAGGKEPRLWRMWLRTRTDEEAAALATRIQQASDTSLQTRLEAWAKCGDIE